MKAMNQSVSSQNMSQPDYLKFPEENRVIVKINLLQNW